MKKKYSKYLIYLLIAGIVIWFLVDSLSQPGVKDLEGNFEEVAAYRNENNTGPIVRVYVVAVEDTVWNSMEKYGNYMLHTKYGNTKVLFFHKDKPYPKDVKPGDQNFDRYYDPFCIAKYEKNNMGFVSFVKYPFSENK